MTDRRSFFAIDDDGEIRAGLDRKIVSKSEAVRRLNFMSNKIQADAVIGLEHAEKLALKLCEMWVEARDEDPLLSDGQEPLSPFEVFIRETFSLLKHDRFDAKVYAKRAIELYRKDHN